MNRFIDTFLPHHRPRFQQAEIDVDGELYDVWFRDIIKCIKALFGDPNLAAYLVFAPERHYKDANKTERLYHDMHTGKWWWATQVSR